ncbi:protein kinase-like domain-containing protein [Artemisia annua]|uniref:Protein kinase-like domain-containing protein n=1 Tax=Artemisia annua TaxID=35608 RepID=A0A2U1KAL1_ARTAN|nr:protein kinase-like domain-containing protein [Artemisia annua]
MIKPPFSTSKTSGPINPPSLSHWNQSSNPCTSWPEITCTANTITGITIKQDIKGVVPPFVCDIKNLTHLDLSWNFFNENFPTGLYNCTSLEYLDLSQNYFVGRIPDDISQLSPELKYLSLLVGIGRLPKLNDIRIFRNNLSGQLPPDFGRYSELKIFEVSDNNFTGNLPKNLCYNGMLKRLIVYTNSLSGEIPNSIGNCSRLYTLWLDRNQFTGELPATIGNLTFLENLQLDDNMFYGNLPEIPINMIVYSIKNNTMSGAIPSSICGSSFLEAFYVSHNNISGTIPNCFQNGSRLTSLKSKPL